MAATVPAHYMSYQQIPRRYHSREKINCSIMKIDLVGHKMNEWKGKEMDIQETMIKIIQLHSRFVISNKYTCSLLGNPSD